MLIVSDTHRFVFLHIPKTGGTSIGQALAPFAELPIPDYRIHARPGSVRAMLGAERFARLEKLCVVRNTWDRLASAWFHTLRKPLDLPIALQLHGQGFEAFLHHAPMLYGQQSDWSSLDGAPMPISILRFERLGAEFSGWCQQRGLTAELPRLNATEGRLPYTQVYTTRTRDLVAQQWAAEIDALGYRFEGEPGSDDPATAAAVEALAAQLHMRGLAERDRAILAAESGDAMHEVPTEQLERALMLPGDLAAGRGDWATALHWYDRARAHFPGNAWLHYSHSLALLRSGEPLRGLAAAEQAARCDPRLTEVWVHLAVIENGLGLHAQAHAHGKAALALEPRHPDALLQLALAAKALGNRQEALAAARDALAEAPASVPVLALAAELTAGSGDWPQAVGLLRRAAAAAPDDAGVTASLDFALRQLPVGR